MGNLRQEVRQLWTAYDGHSHEVRVPDESNLLPDDSSSRRSVVAGRPASPVFVPLTRPPLVSPMTPKTTTRTLSPLPTSPRQSLTLTKMTKQYIVNPHPSRSTLPSTLSTGTLSTVQTLQQTVQSAVAPATVV